MRDASGTDKDVIPLVAAEEVSKIFPIGRRGWSRVHRYIRAVDRVSLEVFPAETVGLVGESGCGKTTLGRLFLRLLKPTAGRIRFVGEDITGLSQRRLRPFRRKMQVIFQDPFSSLNPRLTVRDALSEAILQHHSVRNRRELNARLAALLEMVGLSPRMLDRFPHEFSGGERQRIGIARAVAVEPSFLVADEPLSALDVSIQAQIVNLLIDLQRELGIAYLFISHDLNIVGFLSHRVAVMYLGRVVELARSQDLFREPVHPYTQALLASVPVPDPKRRKAKVLLSGEVALSTVPETGCRFHPRCHIAEEFCRHVTPDLRPSASPDHLVACHKAPTPAA